MYTIGGTMKNGEDLNDSRYFSDSLHTSKGYG